MHRFITSVGLAVVMGVGLVRDAKAQEIASASYERGPRFLLVTATNVVPVDLSKTPVLVRRLNLELEGATLKEALAEIAAQSGLVLAYSDDAVPLEKVVHLRAEAITAAAALTDVLFDAGVDVVFKADGSAALVRRPPAPQNGSVSGRVTDVKTSAAIVGATVVVDRTSLSGTTDNDGRYRIAEVPPGSYTVRGRYIGYSPGSALVTVGADQEVTADLALEKSAQRLDEVVTTGTLVPTEVKALPTPITVITADEIDRQRPQTINDVLRQAVPTAVAFALPSSPVGTGFSVRGASTLVSGGEMKVFVDGIEAASFSTTPVDPKSVERIEVIRGPQAATIYGSDAAGGVIQIFTKRGEPGLKRPRVDAEAALGIIRTPYEGFGAVPRQDYQGSVRGGGSGATYNLGGGFSHTNDYVPNGELSAQSRYSAYAGIGFDRGLLSGDLSGRYLVNNAPLVFNPLLIDAGFVAFSRPQFTSSDFTNQTLGARITVSPQRWSRTVATVGLDRLELEQAGRQPRLTTPGDTLLTVASSKSTKTSFGINTSVQGALGASVSGSLTAGLDHYRLPANAFFTSSALNTTGTIQTQPPGAASYSQTVITNTGYFAQAQVALRNALFLTAGVRAEENSTFGKDLATPVLPRVGGSYVQAIGAATIKLRASYGRAIRAPRPGQTFAVVAPTQITLANPGLGPERQKGWDGGVDLVFGARGSLSVTYYDQAAEDGILFVQLPSDTVPTAQFQNVGRIGNKGVELEGRLNLGPVLLAAQYGYVRSRIEDLGPNFTGTEHVGDKPTDTPTNTAGASLTIVPHTGTTVSTGFAYVGSWRNIDALALIRCIGGTGPCPPDFNFTVDYPGFAKIGLNVTQAFTPQISGFVSVDNLTNEGAYESNNSVPVMGRTTALGVHFSY